MDLNLTFKEFRDCAKPLGGYEKISINELANKYCEATDNHDENTRNVYFCALVLRFWYKINRMYTENLTLNLEPSDYFNWIVDAITLACEPDARAWQKDPRLNAQQIINQTLATRFLAQAYYESNLQKNKGKHQTFSLEDSLGNDENGDSLLDLLEDESAPIYQDSSEVDSLIQSYINNNKLIEAIIIDNIAFKDVFKHEKETVKIVDFENNEQKYTNYFSTFWPFKVVKEMSSLDDAYKEYFVDKYIVSEPALEAAFRAIGKANSQKKYKYLTATIDALKLDLGTF